MSKIVKSQIESNSQPERGRDASDGRCVKDRQITNWKQFTTGKPFCRCLQSVCQRSSNHKLKAIHNFVAWIINIETGVSKIVKSQIESNSQHINNILANNTGCVKDRQITNWKQFTTVHSPHTRRLPVCQRSSNHKLKAIHNKARFTEKPQSGVSKIVKSQIESNSQQTYTDFELKVRCVKDRQITNWKQFTTPS